MASTAVESSNAYFNALSTMFDQPGKMLSVFFGGAKVKDMLSSVKSKSASGTVGLTLGVIAGLLSAVMVSILVCMFLYRDQVVTHYPTPEYAEGAAILTQESIPSACGGAEDCGVKMEKGTARVLVADAVFGTPGGDHTDSVMLNSGFLHDHESQRLNWLYLPIVFFLTAMVVLPSIGVGVSHDKDGRPHYFLAMLVAGTLFSCLFVGAFMAWNASDMRCFLEDMTTNMCPSSLDSNIVQADCAGTVTVRDDGQAVYSDGAETPTLIEHPYKTRSMNHFEDNSFVMLSIGLGGIALAAMVHAGMAAYNLGANLSSSVSSEEESLLADE